MKNIKLVYTDNSTGQFCCKCVVYDQRSVRIVTTNDEYIVIPYYNAYIIREQEIKDDGSL